MEFFIYEYKNRCKTCPKLEINSFFHSIITDKKHFIIIPLFKNINCYMSNIFHPLTCEDCGTQYKGETANEFHIRMDLHRKDMMGCPHITEHVNYCCKGKYYSIQIIEVLPCNGHNEKGIVYENNCRLRLGREDFWMKTLRPNFPYGRNERSKDLIPGSPIGTHFYPNGRSGERKNRCYKN